MDLEQVQPFPKNRIVVAISCKNLLIGRGKKNIACEQRWRLHAK
jgi:hypothetical protein